MTNAMGSAAPQLTTQPERSDRNGARLATTQKPAASTSQNTATLSDITVEQAMARRSLFAASPDTFYQQVMDFKTRLAVLAIW